MAAKVISFRLSNSTIALLDKASKRSHMSRTAIVEYSINLFAKEVKEGTVCKNQHGDTYWKDCDMTDWVRNRVIDAFLG